MAASTPLPATEPPFWQRPDARVLGYRVANCTREEALRWCLWAAQQPESRLLVTLNPEIIVRAARDAQLRAALKAAELMVADGVGVVWAARRAGTPLPERVAGVELVEALLAAGGAQLRVYFLGAKPGVAERAAAVAHRRYGTRIAGYQHGYFAPEATASVVHAIRESGANLLLAALGEQQERFLHLHRAALGVPLMIGVGGTLDVLSGAVRRTPLWTRRLGLEWAYRVGLDPKRWHRFPRLVRFVGMVLRARA